METIKRSELLSLPAELALPASLSLKLRNYTGNGPVQVWLEGDGAATALMLPGQTEAECLKNCAPGQWFSVDLGNFQIVHNNPDDLGGLEEPYFETLEAAQKEAARLVNTLPYAWFWIWDCEGKYKVQSFEKDSHGQRF